MKKKIKEIPETGSYLSTGEGAGSFCYDVFNGDADGIFAHHQYRLARPFTKEKKLITGVKRDIKLLEKLKGVNSCEITVFDISLSSNSHALESLLSADNKIIYFDHHHAGTVPDHKNLSTIIDPSPETCTAIIVNNFLSNTRSPWAVAAAFGDNLHDTAHRIAAELRLSENQIGQLQELGELFNYNGYGQSSEDLHFHPVELAHALLPFADPFDFIETEDIIPRLREGYKTDMMRATEAKQLKLPGKNRAYLLENAPWSRRVSGVFSNLKAREQQESAHAIITENDDKTLRISVRAPLLDRRDADTLCKKFPTGGGRAAAAGINQLPPEELSTFLDAFNTLYSSS